MCATVNSSLLLFLGLCCMRLVAEGLPLHRQERGLHDDDIIAGEDFLNIIMHGSPMRRQGHRRTTTPQIMSASLSSSFPSSLSTNFPAGLASSLTPSLPSGLPSSLSSALPLSLPSSSPSSFPPSPSAVRSNVPSSMSSGFSSILPPRSSLSASSSLTPKLPSRVPIGLSSSSPSSVVPNLFSSLPSNMASNLLSTTLDYGLTTISSEKNVNAETQVVRQIRSTPYYKSQESTPKTEDQGAFLAKLIPGSYVEAKFEEVNINNDLELLKENSDQISESRKTLRDQVEHFSNFGNVNSNHRKYSSDPREILPTPPRERMSQSRERLDDFRRRFSDKGSLSDISTFPDSETFTETFPVSTQEAHNSRERFSESRRKYSNFRRRVPNNRESLADHQEIVGDPKAEYESSQEQLNSKGINQDSRSTFLDSKDSLIEDRNIYVDGSDSLPDSSNKLPDTNDKFSDPSNESGRENEFPEAVVIAVSVSSSSREKNVKEKVSDKLNNLEFNRRVKDTSRPSNSRERSFKPTPSSIEATTRRIEPIARSLEPITHRLEPAMLILEPNGARLATTHRTLETTTPIFSTKFEVETPADVKFIQSMQSEQRPALIAEANKSDFSVDEGDPITTNNNPPNVEYPANVQPITSPKLNSDYLPQGNLKDTLTPYHETVIYHDNPRDSGRARSVSYSTVIQGVPHEQNIKIWNGDNMQNHERQERHYESSVNTNNNFNTYNNNFNNYNQKNETKTNIYSKPPGSMAESNDYYVTTKYNPSDFNESIEKKEDQWKKSDVGQRKHLEPTERNWGLPEQAYGVQAKPYSPNQRNIPLVYGRPEQNYEVDESVSVMTNGRTHGVQPSQPINQQRPQNDPHGKSGQPPKKPDDNQKVGYVVEGRNYRKYRVEERTSDGFIVGEYGVVSHDDGSLRGVRYTADGTISPRLIYDALMKFLAL